MELFSAAWIFRRNTFHQMYYGPTFLLLLSFRPPLSLFLTLNVFAFFFVFVFFSLCLIKTFFFIFVLTLFLFIKDWFGDHGPSPAKTFSRYIPSVFHFATPHELVVWQKCTTPLFLLLWDRLHIFWDAFQIIENGWIPT